LCQEPTGDGRVQNKFTGLLPYACHKFLCAYARLSLRARSHGLSPATTSTTHATFIGNKRKIEPIQSALNWKKKKTEKKINWNESNQKQLDVVQELHSVQLTDRVTVANVSFNVAKKGL